MWLLDEGLPVSLYKYFEEQGVRVETVEFRKWKGLRNGKLVAVAAEAGFQCILTKDRLFAQDASKTLRAYPGIAIVLILLPQLPRKQYLDSFDTHWKKNRITPVAGKMTEWPD